jgi:hypothetical protein
VNRQVKQDRGYLTRPKNQKEYAERAGVLPRYMTMGFWTPRSERRKR